MSEQSNRLIQRFVRDRGHYLGFLRVLSRDPEMAEELFQELSVVVIEKIGTYDASRDFGAWVRGIARNLYLKACREQRKKTGQLAYEPELIDAVIYAYDQREAIEEDRLAQQITRLRHCMEKLPADLRRLVNDRYVSNCNSQRLAELHGRTVPAIETSLSRIRATLLNCVQRSEAVQP